MNRYIENLIMSKSTRQEKLEELATLEKDLQLAKEIVNGRYEYCEECKDYYLPVSFSPEIVSFALGISYRICPNGHKHVLGKVERRDYVDNHHLTRFQVNH